MSFALAWCDFKTYCEEIGPGRGQPPRPAQCVFCDGLRVWFNDTHVSPPRRPRAAVQHAHAVDVVERLPPARSRRAAASAPRTRSGARRADARGYGIKMR